MNDAAAPAPMAPEAVQALMAKVAKVQKIFGFLCAYELVWGILLFSAMFWSNFWPGFEFGAIGLTVAPFFFALGYGFKLAKADLGVAKPVLRLNAIGHLLLLVFALVAFIFQFAAINAVPGGLIFFILLLLGALVPGLMAYVVIKQMQKAMGG